MGTLSSRAEAGHGEAKNEWRFADRNPTSEIVAEQDDRFVDEPFAGNSARFPLSRGSVASTLDEAPSPSGLRPWGLRRMSPVPVIGEPAPVGVYDPARQIRVDSEGRPLVEMAEPTAPTTGSQDGSEGDPSEDYHND